jgi:hypothetical protein
MTLCGLGVGTATVQTAEVTIQNQDRLSWLGEVDLATASYENALQIAASLSRDEQLRLIRELTVRAAQASEEETSVLALCGLGQEIWQHMDAQEYVRRERSSWNG